MQIETDDWTTASESARILGVSHQRVMQMAKEGSLRVARPWPHVLLIERVSLAEWVAGKRLTRIHPAAVRKYVLARTGTRHVYDADIDTVRDLTRAFIAEHRPRWIESRKDLWALDMASHLWHHNAPLTTTTTEGT